MISLLNFLKHSQRSHFNVYYLYYFSIFNYSNIIKPNISTFQFSYTHTLLILPFGHLLAAKAARHVLLRKALKNLRSPISHNKKPPMIFICISTVWINQNHRSSAGYILVFGDDFKYIY